MLAEQADQADFVLREIDSLIDPRPLITPVLMRVARWISDYYGANLESVIRSILPEAVRTEEHAAKTRKVAVLAKFPDQDSLAKIARRAPKQAAILKLLESMPERRMPVAELGVGAASAVRAMAKSGLLEMIDEEVRRRRWSSG